jgi:bacillithiol biosynthesis deacetylase BshB1
MKKIHMLVFGAHPDDAEIGMAGTIAKHAAKGDEVVLVDLTYAELSSNGTVAGRQEEAAEAARCLGVTERLNLGMPDRGIEVEERQVREVARLIRLYQPKVVCSPYPIDRHPDHEACTALIKEALFNAKIRKYDVGEDLPAHEVKEWVQYFINGWVEPDMIVDISDVFVQKEASLKAYRSQFVAGLDAVKTPLNQGYLEMVRSRERWLGQRHGCEYAEGFKRTSPLMIKGLSWEE